MPKHTAISKNHQKKHAKIRSTRLSSSELYMYTNYFCGRMETLKHYVGVDWLDPRNLSKLIEVASYDIHGMLSLRVDGDCFVPPECWCHLGGWGAMGRGLQRGAGGTPNEAILRAIRIREIRAFKYAPIKSLDVVEI